MDKLETYLEKVIADMQATRPKYKSLLRQELETYSIPFFGDVENARVLTVGVNPSATEFEKKRNWHDKMTTVELKDRLQSYFVPEQTVSHKWFKTWSSAMEPLGVSYQDGTAAHVDLSPRATISMGKADPDMFAEMVQQDSQWFFNLLPKCSEARLILFAGCMTKKWYVVDAVKRIAPKYDFQVSGTSSRKGPGWTGFYCLHGPNIELPAFFCSISPSARTTDQKQMLIERVKDHKHTLLELMK